MIASLMRRIVGSKNERELKRIGTLVKKINALEASLQSLSDQQLAAKTPEFKDRLAQGEKLNKLLPEAFAVVREVAQRTLSMRPFDVQLIGGVALHEGSIAEMRTGEGKTLMSTLPVYLNALAGEGVHVVTVNDYLANRDAEWMSPIFKFLGLTVGVILPNQDPETKKQAYAADITYGTNNEFGFDYLRDNMAFSTQDRVQRRLNFAVVDEVDSILIDEARTPLIISGALEDNTKLYLRIDALIPKLKKQDDNNPQGDYIIDEKQRQVELTETGHQHVEDLLIQAKLLKPGDSLYAAANLNLLHHIHAGLKAHALFQREVDYIVRDNEVIIVDEHTGRTMEGRRWSEGIHQAVEAKERVNIQNESQTLASTTFQNYFRLYEKLSGMTGTADTEAFELKQIYGLGVLVIPTHKPMVRDDRNDLIYMSAAEKYQAIIEDIKQQVKQGRPVLVGTTSIETSEYVSSLLNKSKIKHQVLNAKYHEREAEIIAQAGRPGTVTIATNMAGRGTDIKLGGNWEMQVSQLNPADEAKIAQVKADWQTLHEQVVTAGGLHIIGTERHESRRIDNQLRGRAGRQGDPGSSRFYLSLEDNLMRIFASDRIKAMMSRLGMKEGESIEHAWANRAVENAQRKVESRNFDIRKQLLEYDDVANDQRQVVYKNRQELLEAEDVTETIASMEHDVLNEVLASYIPPQSIEEQWDIEGLELHLKNEFQLALPVSQWLKDDDELHEDNLKQKIIAAFKTHYDAKMAAVDPELLKQYEKHILLERLDHFWKEHLANMDHLRQGIHLRGYAQRNPKQEYKREAFDLFQGMLQSIRHDVIRVLANIEIRQPEDVSALEQQRRMASVQQVNYQHGQVSALAEPQQEAEGDGEKPQPVVRQGPKVGRNEPCPCGSGRKYKHCHGRL